MVNGLMSCEKPYVNRETGVVYTCGSCRLCRRRKVQEWIMRCSHELITCDGVASFVTFTYKPKFLRKLNCTPRNEFDRCGCLHEPDMQRMFKRMRKAGLQFRYFYCGEYGSLKMRPHYHVLFFGLSPSVDYQSFWPYGHVDVSPYLATEKTVGYICGYVAKKSADFSDRKYFDDNLRPRPYIRQSKGLGGEWADAHVDDWIESLTIGFNRGQVPVPRYYLIRQFKKEGLVIRRVINNSTVYYKVVRNPDGPVTSRILDRLYSVRVKAVEGVADLPISDESKSILIDKFFAYLHSLYISYYAEFDRYRRMNIKVEYLNREDRLSTSYKLSHPYLSDVDFALMRSCLSYRRDKCASGVGNHHEFFDVAMDVVGD